MATETEKTFDYRRYWAQSDSKGSYTLQDGSDALANQGFVISVHHLSSNKSVYFKAFITAFNETYSPDWAPETVYGRADPIYFFKNTTRNITLGFKIPAASEGEAYENLARVQELVQFLYPTYIDVQNANTISQAPLVRLKVMNLLRKSTAADPLDPAERGAGSIAASETYKAYTSTSDSSQGLLGVISNLAITHNLENETHGVFEKAENTILPKLIDITMDFKPIHEHPVGWDAESGEFAESTAFPYGAPAQIARAEEDLVSPEDVASLEGIQQIVAINDRDAGLLGVTVPPSGIDLDRLISESDEDIAFETAVSVEETWDTARKDSEESRVRWAGSGPRSNTLFEYKP